MAFLPSDLSGLKAWYDAQNSSSIIQNSGIVTQWNDLSGQGVNVANVSGSQQPSYSTTALNYLPAIVFTGAFNQYLSANVLPFTSFSAFTVFTVVKPTSFNSFGTIYALGAFGDELDIASDNIPRLITYMANDAITSEGESVAILTANTNYYFVNKFNGTLATWRINGADDAAVVTMHNGTPITIGTSATFVGGDTFGEAFDGAIGEIIVYNRLLSEIEIGQVEAYIVGRWFEPQPPPVTVVLGGTMGADMGDYERQVRMYWERIEDARKRQQQKEDAQRQLKREASVERGRIHARMAELRAIKARKRADKERIAAEMQALAAEEVKLKADLAAADAVVLKLIDYVNEQILLLEAYKRRYQASLIMLLLGVN